LAAVHVLDTLPRECAETTCADAPGGTALAAIGEGVLIAEEFEVDRARLCGAQVATGGALDLRRGRIAGATVGACVQVAGYDVSRLTNDVAFADNGVNVDATDHAVPEPGDPLPVF